MAETGFSKATVTAICIADPADTPDAPIGIAVLAGMICLIIGGAVMGLSVYYCGIRRLTSKSWSNYHGNLYFRRKELVTKTCRLLWDFEEHTGEGRELKEMLLAVIAMAPISAQHGAQLEDDRGAIARWTYLTWERREREGREPGSNNFSNALQREIDAVLSL
ncbi:hypothetical protein EG329_013934 [Mollisiaceae sp. DMI_Dod_QoI]|nr:hypothetical protein EG329_013934 [Helotiales sp. DMI_Dod_QoI]